MSKRTALTIAAAMVVACGPFLPGLHADEAMPETARVDHVIIDKSDHTLSAYQGEVLLKTYRVAIGRGASGAKLYGGDRRTPEGVYRVRVVRRSARFEMFIALSYPNAEDRRRYREARRRGEIPGAAGIGGAIGIHGWSDRWVPRFIDWTAGCIAMEDDEIRELAAAVDAHTRVEIVP